MAPDRPLRLSDTEITKLCAILALLSSDKSGEVQAAGAAATRFLQQRNLQWRDLLVPILPKPDAPPRFDLFADWPARWRAAGHFCWQAPEWILSDWDSRFLATIAGYAHRPSDRQLDILATIVGNVLAAGVSQ